MHVGEDGVGLLGGEDGGQAALAAGGLDAVEVSKFDTEDLAVEEEEGAEGLVLGGGGDVALNGEVCEEAPDVIGAEVARVAQVVEVDVAADPADVGLFGAVTVVAGAQGGAEGVEEGGAGHGRCGNGSGWVF